MSAPDRAVRGVLFGWPVLPERALAAAGPATCALMDAGCATSRGAGRWLHALPYGRNAERSDWLARPRAPRISISRRSGRSARRASARSLGPEADRP